MGMNITNDDLLPGEHLIISRFANIVLSVKKSGLSRFAFDGYMGLIGMKGKEAMGGRAYLTNYRIIFKSHFFNRIRGRHSIFLSNIVDVTATLNNLKVETTAQTFEFVMWFKSDFISGIKKQKAEINSVTLKELKDAVISNPKAIGDNLHKWTSLEIINQSYLILEHLSGTDKNAFIEVLELLHPEKAD